MTTLVTGAAGFIGYHVARKLAERGERVVGVDNLTDFYGTELKRRRLVQLSTYPNFKFYRLDLSEKNALPDALQGEPVDIVIHLAAQANVRYAIENPHAYVHSNVAGHLNVLEYCRHARDIENLDLCLVEFRLRGAERDPLSRRRRDRPPDFALRGDEEVAGDDERRSMRTSSAFRRSGCASSPSMARGAGRTWPIGCSPRRS